MFARAGAMIAAGTVVNIAHDNGYACEPKQSDFVLVTPGAWFLFLKWVANRDNPAIYPQLTLNTAGFVAMTLTIRSTFKLSHSGHHCPDV